MRKDVLVLVVIFALVIGGLVFLASRSGGSTPAPGPVADPTLLVRASSHMTGKSGAKVTVVEFGDFQCPACGAAYPVVKQTLAAYQSDPDFNFVFRNFPLPMHPNAPMAAEAAEAAGEQGKFWEMYDKLYENQAAWADLGNPLDVFVKYASDLGLDAAKFKLAVRQNKFASLIQADMNDATALGINATPTFYVNGRAIVGVPDRKALNDLINMELKR